MTDTEVLIRDCLTTYADTAELADLVGAAKARGRQLSRGGADRVGTAKVRRFYGSRPRGRLILTGAIAVVILLVGTAFVLGGRQGSVTHEALTLGKPPAVGAAAPSHQADNGATAPKSSARSPLLTALPPAGSPGNGNALHQAAPTVTAFGPIGQTDMGIATGTTSNGSAVASSASGGVGATRVVKTGDLSLRVRRGQVQAIVSQVGDLTRSLGGYVSQSRTENIAGAPRGELTLRMPVAKFDETVSDVEKLGHEISLSTNAHDVTGQFVDLGARLSALKHTRATYLTILGGAHTIGATLAVQERIDSVQSQIERYQGQLKVLRNQSADGTLTVDVSQAGSPTPAARHHQRHGISKAWHTSISRFSRGVDAIVGALGPLLLVLLVVAFLAIVAGVGLRVVRRTTS